MRNFWRVLRFTARYGLVFLAGWLAAFFSGIFASKGLKDLRVPVDGTVAGDTLYSGAGELG